MPNVPKPPKYFSFNIGIRFANIIQIHNKLRHNYVLKHDLYKRDIINNPLCLCGKTEYLFHFSSFIKKISRARNNLFYQLFMLHLVNIDTSLVL